MKGSRVVVGAMSHEIRNICAAIALAHRNLLRSPSPEVAGDLDTLAAMLDALEKVSSVELRSTNLPPVEVDLTPILEDLRIIIAPLLRDEGIGATWTVPANIPLVWGERSQFMQTFLNLANNSIHALQQAADKRLAVSVHVGTRRVLLEFLDSGGGVQQPEKLFRPFEAGTGGSGLGLYISRAFIASFGGDMSYKPVPGHACFQVELVRVSAKDDR
jgi:signal transduction histidine kinase